jgi:hypothetical protein
VAGLGSGSAVGREALRCVCHQVVALVVLGAVVGLLGSGDALAVKPPCPRAPEVKLAASDRAVVYAFGDPLDGGWEIRLCEFRTRRRVRLSFDGGLARIAGRFVALDATACNKSNSQECNGGVLIYDLDRRARRVIRTIGANRASDLVLSRHGDAAWIKTTGRDPIQRLTLARRGKAPITVAESPTLTPGSLALTPGGSYLTYLFWRDGDSAQSVIVR